MSQKKAKKGGIMNDLKKLRDKYYRHTVMQKEEAWKEKDFKKAVKIRKSEKENYEKWKLLDGIIKEMEKENEKNK